MAKIKGKLFPALTLLLVLIVLGGCTAQKNRFRLNRMHLTGFPKWRLNPLRKEVLPRTGIQSADIRRIAESVPGVERSYTVVVGNAVLIGLDLDRNQQEQGISNIKNRVAEKAEADSRIVRAYVSSDPDTTARIRELADNVRKGRPVTEYLDEIGEIIQRLTPQTD